MIFLIPMQLQFLLKTGFPVASGEPVSPCQRVIHPNQIQHQYLGSTWKIYFFSTHSITTPLKSEVLIMLNSQFTLSNLSIVGFVNKLTLLFVKHLWNEVSPAWNDKSSAMRNKEVINLYVNGLIILLSLLDEFFWKWNEGGHFCTVWKCKLYLWLWRFELLLWKQSRPKLASGEKKILGIFQTVNKVNCNSVILVRGSGPRCEASMCRHNTDALKHQSKLQQILREQSFDNQCYRSQQRLTQE